MARMWYAIVYAYGRHVVNRDGNRADHIHAFPTKGARDAFIDAEDRDGRNVDAIAASHPIVKRALRYHRQGEPWPVAVMGA